MLVNNLHIWLVIKWFSIMFNFHTSFRVLEFVHWSDRDITQDPWFHLIKSRLRGVLSYLWLYTWLYRWLWPYRGSIYMILSIRMTASIPWIHAQILSIRMVVTMPWIHVLLDAYSCIIRHIIDFRYVYVYAWFAGILMVFFRSFPWLVINFTHHSLFCLHALGGICYIVFCHTSCSLPVPHPEVQKCWQLWIIFIMKHILKYPWRMEKKLP